jgi:hypothetical protein
MKWQKAGNALPVNIMMIKLRRIRWAEYVESMGEMRMRINIWLGSLKWSNNSEDPDVDGKIIVKSLFREKGGRLVQWLHLPHDGDRWQTLVNMEMNYRISWKMVNLLTSWVTIGFWRCKLVCKCACCSFISPLIFHRFICGFYLSFLNL